jgi:acetyl-CoA synthetase
LHKVVQRFPLHIQMQIKEFKKLYKESIENPEKFWADVASAEIEWFKKWDKVFEWNFPDYKWFIGGKLNVTYNCLDRHIKNGLGEKVAYIYTNENYEKQTITYAQLLSAVNKFANGLKSLGIKKGDKIVLYMPLAIEQIISMLACARIGAVHSVVFAGFSDKALRERMEDLHAKIIITATYSLRRGIKKELKPTVEEAVKGLDFVESVIVFNRDCVIPSERSESRNPLNVQITSDRGSLRSSSDPGSRADKSAHYGAGALGLGRDDRKNKNIDFYQLMENQSDVCEPVWMDSEDQLFVLYTSGSTGKPKGIVHTVGGYSVYVHYTAKKVFDLRANDIFWCTADPGWITGHSYLVYGPLSNGLTSVIVEGVPDYPTPDHWYKIIEEEKVSIFYTSPTAIRMLRKYGEEFCKKYGLSSLRILGTVGEPISPEVWQWYNVFIGKNRCPIEDTWWQTETGGHMIVNLPGFSQKPGVAGKPFFGILADVVDKEAHSLKPGEKGFLIIKKPWPSALRGCLNEPKRFLRYWDEIKGVYFTGDFAIKDEEGCIQILGRSDDVINISGHRVGTAEVESALVSHESVSEAAVISKPDEIKRERIKAFLVLKENFIGNQELINNIKHHVRMEIASIAVPDEIEIVQSVPKTRSGKIMRRVLKARELGQDEGDLSVLDK